MSKTLVCDGNEAAAWGVALARPDMVAVYPITPQSSLAEYISQFVADGIIKADLMDVEGEHSVLSVLQGACLAGARTFTASCGQGLAFMFEPYYRTPALRLPIVMSIVTRDGITPQSVWGGQQDAMTVREAGWIHMYCENVQEVLDTVVMAYKIAEHRDIMLPVNVNHDGNYLSYGVEKVELPDGEGGASGPGRGGRVSGQKGYELARCTRSGAAHGSGSSNRRGGRRRTGFLRSLPQRIVQGNAECVEVDPAGS